MTQTHIPISADQILVTLRNRKEILEKYGVKRIGIFGSNVSGRTTEKSDIDFVVEFNKPDLDNYMDLLEFLENLFAVKVDLLTPAGIDSIRIGYIKDSIKNSTIYV